jgi:hypothetical protein
MYRCSCNGTLEVKVGSRLDSPIGLPASFVTHVRCFHNDCANRNWQVVSDIDGRLYLEHNGKCIGVKEPRDPKL